MDKPSRPFDIRPTLAILVFSLILSGSLIVVNSAPSQETVSASGSSRVETADLDDDEQGDGASDSDDDAGDGPDPDSGDEIENTGTANAARVLAGPTGGDAGQLASAEPVDDDDTAVTTTTTQVIASPNAAPTTSRAPVVSTTARPITTAPRVTSPPTTAPTTTARPTTTRRPTTTTAAPTTTRRPTTTTAAPTTTRPPSSNGRFTVAQVIDGTISSGDGSNPNEEAPMGRHDAPLYLPQAWDWAQGPTRNAAWGQLGTGGSRYAEFRCAVIPENGHNPPVDFRINVRNAAYYQFANGNWNKAFDVDLTSGHRGGYLGNAGVLNNDPFSAGGHGRITWRQEADGSFSAPWNSNALMMHFWAGQRRSPAPGQTAEFLSSEVRLQQPDGQTVDLSRVRVLFQCGVDYYNNTGGQGTKVPGPGIGKYHRVTTGWTPGLWVTLPSGVPANSTQDFRTWLDANLPPNVRR